MPRRALDKAKVQKTTSTKKRGRPKAVPVKEVPEILITEEIPVSETAVFQDPVTKEFSEVEPPKQEISDVPTEIPVEKERIKGPEDISEEREPSSFIHISNLVRPFTIANLQILLKQFGQFDPQKDFWIDAIKSNCYVKYKTVEQATLARTELDGTKWPEDSPKLLKIEFSENNKMAKDTFGMLGTTSEAPLKVSESSSVSNPIEEKISAPKSVCLHDLFKKTTCQPHIYWLPANGLQAENKLSQENQIKDKSDSSKIDLHENGENSGHQIDVQ